MYMDWVREFCNNNINVIQAIIASGVLAKFRKPIWNFFKSFCKKIDTFNKLEFYLKQIMEMLLKQGEKISSLSNDISTLKGLTTVSSPLSLTEKGENILTNSGGRSYVDNNKVSLIFDIKSKDPKNHYDIQEFSKQVVEDHKNDFVFNVIKENCYQNGISLNDALLCMSIYLRDIAIKDINLPSTLPIN